jgi:hypothetical protein
VGGTSLPLGLNYIFGGSERGGLEAGFSLTPHYDRYAADGDPKMTLVESINFGSRLILRNGLLFRVNTGPALNGKRVALATGISVGYSFR